ncbi:hypothetical protein ACIGO6_39950, partial [Streptomyces sp. NPDC053750]
MAKAGRPQGGLKGATQEANALAEFLREITEGSGVRELAVRYEGVGKTLWGEYRSGVRIVPLGRLNAVVKDRFHDARSQQVMLAKARSLHDAAVAAEGRAGSILRSGTRDSGRSAAAEGAVVRGEAAPKPDEPSAGQELEETAEGTDTPGPLGAGAGQDPDPGGTDDPTAQAADTSRPVSSPGEAGSARPVRVRWTGAAVAVLVAASTAGGIFIATHLSDTAGNSKQPEVLLSPPPSSSAPGGDLNLPGVSTGPTTPDRSRPTPPPLSAPPSSVPASSAPEVSRPRAGKAGIVVATSSRLYRITADSEVEEYTGKAGAWTVIRKGT